MTTILLVVAIALAVVAITMSIKACYVLGTNERHYSKMFDLMNKSIDNLEEQAKDIMNAVGRINKDVCDIQDVFGDTDSISNTIQLAANEAVSDAMDQIDRNLDNNVRAINTIWQSVGTLKKRMDKLDPVKRDPIDPVENLQKQTEMMDTMLKQSTDIYAEKLKTSNKSEQNTRKMPETALTKKYMDKLQDLMEKERLDDVDKLEHNALDWNQEYHIPESELTIDEHEDDIPDVEDTQGLDLADFFKRREENPTEVLDISRLKDGENE